MTLLGYLKMPVCLYQHASLYLPVSLNADVPLNITRSRKACQHSAGCKFRAELHPVSLLSMEMDKYSNGAREPEFWFNAQERKHRPRVRVYK